MIWQWSEELVASRPCPKDLHFGNSYHAKILLLLSNCRRNILQKRGLRVSTAEETSTPG